MVKEGKKYTESHEWFLIEDQEATIGVTDYAQQELGSVVFVELPEVGAELHSGKEAVVLESTKAAADVYSPLSGKVTAVNETLNDQPDLVNSAPECEGWLFKIKLANDQEIGGFTEEEYTKITGQ